MQPNWSQIYIDGVAPAMERFAAPVPLAIWAVLAVLVVVGALLLAFGSGSVRLGGMVPIAVVGFVAFMVLGQPSRVGEPATYRMGVVESLRHVHTSRTSVEGHGEQHDVWFVTLRAIESAEFTAEGVRDIKDVVETLELLVDEALYEQLSIGQDVIFVSYPGVGEAVSFAVTPD